MSILFAARTDVGRHRETNEDNFLVDRKLQLYVLCDGMGGHQSGEVASATAVNVVREALLKNRSVLDAYERADVGVSERDVLELLEQAVQQASYRVYERGVLNAEQRGMGTTLSLLLVIGNRGFIGHVGDSRIYSWRHGHVRQLTDDHSLYNEMLRTGQLTPELALEGRLRNAVTRAVGVYESVQVDTLAVSLEPGERLLLCSDGLHGYFEEGDIERLIATEDLNAAAEGMIRYANEAGGRDNVTAIVVQISADGEELGQIQHALHFGVIRAQPTFDLLTDLDLRHVIAAMREIVLAPGETLVTEGDKATGLFLVVEGALDVLAGGAAVARVLCGQTTAEFALLVRAEHRAHLVAVGATTVLELTRGAFQQLVVTNAPLGARLTWLLALDQGRRLLTRAATAGELAAVYGGTSPLSREPEAFAPHFAGEASDADLSGPAGPPDPSDPAGAMARPPSRRVAARPVAGPTATDRRPAPTTTQDLDPAEILEDTDPSVDPPPPVPPAPATDVPGDDPSPDR